MERIVRINSVLGVFCLEKMIFIVISPSEDACFNRKNILYWKLEIKYNLLRHEVHPSR